MINRFIINKLQEEIDQPHVNILLGARQVGKTTILKQLQHYAQTRGKSTAFFDLELPDVLTQFNQPDAHIIQTLVKSAQIVFIDEFQYIKNASKIFKAIYDAHPQTKIICSGSSSLEMHKHLKESLAGRRFTFRVYPLTFAEIQASPVPLGLDEYFVYGGMPALMNFDSNERRQNILAELVANYILKDIKALVKEENLRAFNHLLYLLAENQGSLVSTHSLAREVMLSSPAVQRYLDILEETYVNYRLYSFSSNLGNELKKSFKTYIFDSGMRNAIVKDFSPCKDRKDKGVLGESFAFLKLQTILSPNKSLRFWRTKTGEEVDFILLVNRKPIPIEVKSGLTAPEIPCGLKRFLSRYPQAKQAYVVNERLSQTITHQSCAIKFITFENFAQLESQDFA